MGFENDLTHKKTPRWHYNVAPSLLWHHKKGHFLLLVGHYGKDWALFWDPLNSLREILAWKWRGSRTPDPVSAAAQPAVHVWPPRAARWDWTHGVRLHLAWLYKGKRNCAPSRLHSVNGGVGGLKEGVMANSHLVVLKTPGMLLL